MTQAKLRKVLAQKQKEADARDARDRAGLPREEIVTTCDYCGKPRSYDKVLGDIMFGACHRRSCVLQSMREHL